MPAYMMMSRGIRRVPKDYEPPTNDRTGRPEPCFDEFYVVKSRQWLAQWEEWQKGEHPNQKQYQIAADVTFEDWDGKGPDPDYYYPGERWPEGSEMGIRMYESVTEGTPISRWYPDTDEGREAMAEELAGDVDTGITSHLTKEDWLNVINEQVSAVDIHTGEIL